MLEEEALVTKCTGLDVRGSDDSSDLLSDSGRVLASHHIEEICAVFNSLKLLIEGHLFAKLIDLALGIIAPVWPERINVTSVLEPEVEGELDVCVGNLDTIL